MNQRHVSLFSLSSIFSFFVVLVLNILLIGCVQTGKEPLSLQSGKQDGLPVDINGKNIKRGLTVVYFDNKFRHIKEMPKSEESIIKFGRPGAPILKLDHQFGKGEVFESGKKEAVGVLLRGYLHLDRPGKYLFQALSNDGFELFIDGNLIVIDPKVHGDRLSETGEFNVERGGMFPVEIKYFQRKGTAALRLFWQPSGASFYTIIPSSVYSHLEE
jgi:hypothetical protein